MTDAALILFGLVLGVYVGAYFATRGYRLRAQEDAALISALNAELEQLETERAETTSQLKVASDALLDAEHWLEGRPLAVYSPEWKALMAVRIALGRPVEEAKP